MKFSNKKFYCFGRVLDADRECGTVMDSDREHGTVLESDSKQRMVLDSASECGRNTMAL